MRVQFPFLLRSIKTVELPVSDIMQTTRFYRDVLGLWVGKTDDGTVVRAGETDLALAAC